MRFHVRTSHALLLALVAAAHQVPLSAQSLIQTMPGRARITEMRGQIPGSVVSGALRVTWADDGTDASHTIVTVAAGATTWPHDRPPTPVRRGASATPSRRARAGSAVRGGRSPPTAPIEAVYRDRNLFVTEPTAGRRGAVTTDGSEAGPHQVRHRQLGLRRGTGSGHRHVVVARRTKLAYYRFDESAVPDYYLQFKQTEIQDSLDMEAYPKAGAPNPVVDLFVYDLATGRSTRMDVRDGKPFTDDVVGHYVYDVAWTPTAPLDVQPHQPPPERHGVHRVHPRHRCVPRGGARGMARLLDGEPPPRQYLADGKRFLWISERTGFANIYLYDLSGTLLRTLTEHPFEVAGIEHVDEKAGMVWYTARDGDNPMKVQLHRIGLNGKGDRRLTDPAFNHTVDVAPDGQHFIDVAQTHDQAPVTPPHGRRGRQVAELATSDEPRSTLWACSRSSCSPSRPPTASPTSTACCTSRRTSIRTSTYPLLVSVYAGPATNGARETFTTPNALTEYGFLVASLDSRSAAGTGQAVPRRHLPEAGHRGDRRSGRGCPRPGPTPVRGRDPGRHLRHVVRRLHVGHGHPAPSRCVPGGVGGLAVTDWRNYDSIYTERYMWLPQENAAGYDAGSAMTYADKLRGRLMIYYGTADNNVHPSNSLQLIQALQSARKSFDVQVGPTRVTPASTRTA